MNFNADAGPPRTTPEADDASGIQYSLLFLAPPERSAAAALYAFWCEMERLSQDVREPAAASVKLAWWQEELGRAYDAAPRHPLAMALAPAIARYALPREHFIDLLAGVAADLACPAHAAPDDVDRYCRAVGGNAMHLLARISGSTDRVTDAYAADLGAALQLARLVLRANACAPLAARYIAASTETPAPLRTHSERAVHDLSGAGPRLPASERARQTPAAILAAIAVATLRKLDAAGYPRGRTIRLSPPRMLWIAWRTAREARK